MYTGRLSSMFPDFTELRIAAGRIFAVIDRTPVIDSQSEDGKIPQVRESTEMMTRALKFLDHIRHRNYIDISETNSFYFIETIEIQKF